jgi:transcriptional regulator with XRE-family HTH domain
VIHRRRLAAELHRLREAAGLTCGEVAARLDFSASKISRIETGRVLVSPQDVRDLLDTYGVPEDQRDRLIQLAHESRQKGWWQGFGYSVDPNLATYLGMEGTASEIRYYSATRIPALLQTEDYARAVVAAGRSDSLYPYSGGRSVALMMERQRLAREKPPSVWAVLDEAAVRRQVGGQAVMRGQVDHLIELSSTRTMFLQLIPFGSGAYVAMDLPFAILSYPDPADPDVVCTGYQTGVLWIEEAAEVHRFTSTFHHLQAVALPVKESVALMTSVLSDV